VSTAATGTGKTYTFFLPALFEKNTPGVSFIIIPLRKLADQHVESAKSLGLMAIALEAGTINKETVKACTINKQLLMHEFMLLTK